MACPKVLTESPMTIQRPLQRCHHTASLKWISLLPLDPTIFSCSIHSKGCKPAKLDGNKKNQNGEIRFLTAVERRGHVNHTMGAYNRMQAGTLIQSSTHFHSHLLSTAKKKKNRHSATNDSHQHSISFTTTPCKRKSRKSE